MSVAQAQDVTVETRGLVDAVLDSATRQERLLRQPSRRRGATGDVRLGGPVSAGSTTRQVVFVGAGPGEPDLLTVRAAALVSAAEVLVVADVASAGRWAAAADGARMVGIDAAGGPAERARLLAELCAGGAAVVRVVHGDVLSAPGLPEEVAACRALGVGVRIVPGLAPATAWTTFAGVPLGRRDGGPLQVLDLRTTVDTDPAGPVAATLRDGGTAVVLGDPDALAGFGRTVSSRLPDVGDVCALVTRNPGSVRQVSASGTLGRMAQWDRTGADVAPQGPTGEGERPTAEAVLVLGPGAGDTERLDWFESRPLFGWQVLVPRTREQAGTLDVDLRAHGAVPVEVPTICVEPPRTPQQMDKAIRGLVEGRYEWVAFTSANALRAVREKVTELGLDARAMSGLKIAAVGQATADALRAWGIEPDLVPTGDQSAAGLVAEFPEYDRVLDPINRVLLPRADIATDTLAAGLLDMGWEVDDVTAYRTVRAAPPPAPVREAIKAGRFDAVLFTSSSTVRNLVGIAGKPHATTVVACIGPQTARTAVEHGLTVSVVADSPSVPDLTRALAEFAAGRASSLAAAGKPVVPPSRTRARRPAAPRPRPVEVSADPTVDAGVMPTGDAAGAPGQPR